MNKGYFFNREKDLLEDLWKISWKISGRSLGRSLEDLLELKWFLEIDSLKQINVHL